MSQPHDLIFRYYALQVATRHEPRYLKAAGRLLERRPDLRLLWPRRSLRIRRDGRWRDILQPIFPGYLFVEVEQITTELFAELRRLPGFQRFLRSNQDIQPVSERDARPLAQLLSYGEVVRKSIATFDENHRIRIIDGPLKGLEGLIVKVDRRKGRAKVKLDLYDESRMVDFGFTSLESGAERAGEKTT